MQQLEGSVADTQIEIVWGIGIAVWNIQGVEISINDATMAFEIHPRDVEERLELDIFHALDNPGAVKLEKLHKQIE